MSRTKMLETDYEQLAKESCEESGIPWDYATGIMKVEVMDAKTCSKFLGQTIRSGGYLIPYWTEEGLPLLLDHVNRYGRIRRLGPNVASAKYMQPIDTRNEVYFPQGFYKLARALGWAVITEGERKAAKAVMHGIPCCAVGGVDSWRGSDGALHADLARLREVVPHLLVLGDGDCQDNRFASGGLQQLAVELRAPFRIVPPAAGKLDDWLVLNDDDTDTVLRKLRAWSGEPAAVGGNVIDAINAEWGLVRFPTTFVHISDGKLVDERAMRLLLAHLPEQHSGRGHTRIPALQHWLRHPDRRTYDHMVYEPRREIVGAYNLWTGFGVEPVEGDCQPWLDLVCYLFGGDTAVIDWWDKRMALTAQTGCKLPWALLLWGTMTGIGKSTLGRGLAKMYGRHGCVIPAHQLFDSFNGSWAKATSLVVVEERDGDSKMKRAHADQFKAMLTEDTLVVNEKFQPRYSIANRIMFVLTSNHPDAYHIDSVDRRYLVIETPTVRKPGLLRVVNEWVDAGGMGHVLHRWLNMDISGVNGQEQPPMTAARADMVEMSYSDLERALTDLVADDAAEPIPGLGADIVPMPVALKWLETWQDVSSNGTALGRTLKRITGLGSRLIRQKDDRPVRAVCMRNPKVWGRVSNTGWQEELRKGEEWRQFTPKLV